MSGVKMIAVTTPTYTDPSGYQLTEVPIPAIQESTDVVINVHAASVNPIDIKKANGRLKMAIKDNFPYKIGYDCAGTVVQVGSEVARFKPGDEVYVRLPEQARGSWAEYARCPASYIAPKPASMSFVEAASVPLAAMTAYQALKRYKGDLAGKTVFVPAGLSGTGLFACQLAKNVFKAGRVITTVSTSKVGQVSKLLGSGVVDEIIDYTKSDPYKTIPRQSVDFVFDTVGAAMKCLPLMRPKTGMIISISTIPDGDQLNSSEAMHLGTKLPFFVHVILNLIDGLMRLRAKRWSVHYEYLMLKLGAKDLESITRFIEEGQVKTVVGQTAKLKEIDEVRAACQTVFAGKGGLGKTVIEVVPKN